MSVIPDKPTRLIDIPVFGSEVSPGVILEATFTDGDKRLFEAVAVLSEDDVGVLLDADTGKPILLSDIAPSSGMTQPLAVPKKLFFGEVAQSNTLPFSFRLLPNEPLALYTSAITIQYHADGSIAKESVKSTMRVSTPSHGTETVSRVAVIAVVAASILLLVAIGGAILLMQRKRMHDATLKQCSRLIDGNPKHPNNVEIQGRVKRKDKAKRVSGGSRRSKSRRR